MVINAAEVKFSGNKFHDKKYTWHTGYPGGLKQNTVKEIIEKKPEEVLRKAVLGMLNKNKLRKLQAKKLRIFPDEMHFYQDQLPPGTKSVIEPTYHKSKGPKDSN